MKKSILITFFLFISYGVQSQILIALLLGDKLNTGKIEFGLDGGYSYANVAGMEANNKLSQFNLGFYFDIKMKEQWYLNTGVLVKSTLGVAGLSMNDLDNLNATVYKNEFGDIIEGEYSQKISSFLIPLLAKYKFKNNIYAEGGLQIGWMYNSWIEFNSDIEGNSARIKEKNKDETNWFDMGVAVGTGYRLLNGYGWTLGARYYYGFTDVYTNISGTNNSALFLKLNIPIGVSEKTKKVIDIEKEKRAKKRAKKKADKKESKNTKK